MDTFILDPTAAETLIASLRGDAAALSPTDLPPLPDAGPSARLSSALRAAVAVTNDQTALLSREAFRIAGNMEVFVTGATQIDADSSRRMEAIQP